MPPLSNDKSNGYDGNMKTDAEWTDETKHLLRAEMTRRGVTYEQLSEKLAAIGITDSPVNLRNKVARGKFTAVFLVQCLAAMGAQRLRLDQSD
jgi:hypothetical protein